MINVRKLEADLWESADLLRAGSKLTSNQYCMPVLGLLFFALCVQPLQHGRERNTLAQTDAKRPCASGRSK